MQFVTLVVYDVISLQSPSRKYSGLRRSKSDVHAPPATPTLGDVGGAWIWVLASN